MSSNVLAEDLGDILTDHIDSDVENVVLVNPEKSSVASVVETLHGRDDSPRVDLLATADFFKEVMADFYVASRAADLVQQELLSLAAVDEQPTQSLLLTEDDLTALVTVAGGIGGLYTDEDHIVTAVSEHVGSIESMADPFELQTPALSRVRETMGADLGESTVADFDAVLSRMARNGAHLTTLDEVTICLLVAARNGELLYDVSKWGEDVGIASKATFSRTKTRLEEAGVLDTEKVPIQVGRPRLRLLLGDERLATVEPAEMADRARQLLTN